MAKVTFKPNILLTIIAIIALIIFTALGIWQLHRYEEKERILKQLERKIAAKPLSIKQLPRNNQERQYQPIKLQGTFLNNQQFLLDNQIHQGKVGYDVITPMRTLDLKNLVLINRGWIPIKQTRRVLPALSPVFGLQTIHGIIRMPLAKGIILRAENLQGSSWPIRIQQLDFQLMAKLLKQPVYPFVVLLDKDAPHGFVRDWKFVNMQPAKHVGYAVQWFSFALVLVIIYFALTIKREKKDEDEDINRLHQ